MRLSVKQLKKLIKEASSFVPSRSDTADIQMSWAGPELYFNGQVLKSGRNITTKPETMQQAAQQDIATARQTIDDLISMPEIRFVVDAENNGDSVPMPVDQYIRDTQAYIDSMKREAGISEALTQAKLGISSPHRPPPGPSVRRTCAECGNQWSSSQALYRGYSVPEKCAECGSNDVVSAAGPRAPDSGFDMSAHATGKAARNLMASLGESVLQVSDESNTAEVALEGPSCVLIFGGEKLDPERNLQFDSHDPDDDMKSLATYDIASAEQLIADITERPAIQYVIDVETLGFDPVPVATYIQTLQTYITSLREENGLLGESRAQGSGPKVVLGGVYMNRKGETLEIQFLNGDEVAYDLYSRGKRSSEIASSLSDVKALLVSGGFELDHVEQW